MAKSMIPLEALVFGVLWSPNQGFRGFTQTLQRHANISTLINENLAESGGILIIIKCLLQFGNLNRRRGIFHLANCGGAFVVPV